MQFLIVLVSNAFIEQMQQHQLFEIPIFFISSKSLLKIVTGQPTVRFQEREMLEYINKQSDESRRRY
jgi:hypothetical protein